MKVCCFTGHRTLPSGVAVRLAHALDRHLAALYDAGVREFRTGGALGFDTLAALRVLALRERHPDCRLVLYLPCRGQSDAWREGERALYADILAKADEAHFLHERYTPTCMQERNRAMVDGSDVCIAYLARSTGGTKQTFLYALRQGLEVINLAEELSQKNL